jgi:hypothetical protein
MRRKEIFFRGESQWEKLINGEEVEGENLGSKLVGRCDGTDEIVDYTFPVVHLTKLVP